MKKRIPFVFVLVFAICASAAPDLAPMLRERLAETAALYRDAPAWRADIEVISTIEAKGVTTVATNRFRVLAEKLCRLRISADENGQRYELLCDGTNVWLYREETREYLAGKQPADWTTRPDDEAGYYALSVLHSVPLLFSLLSQDPENSLLEDVLSGSDEGIEPLDGRRLHRMRFVQEHFQWDLLTDEPGSPWIRQADILLTGGTNRAFRYRVIAKFLDQQANPEITEDTFRFLPPEGAKQVKTFISAAHASAEPPNEMLGRPAPEISLRFLSGETRELSSHRGTNVVVLDFWASWCPPCRRALPIVQEVARRWTSSNVVFYAVNRQEPIEKIKAFVEETGLDLPVVLDTDELAEGFAVESIPHLVVIDTNGIIQFVHVGYSPNLGEELDDILARVLAGEPVAASIREAREKEAEKESVGPKPYKARPIPASPDAFTARDYQKLKAAFVHRQNIEFYLQTRSTADGEDEILALLGDYERLLVGSEDPVPSASEFVDRARALIEKGYDHPLIHYVYGAFLRRLMTRSSLRESQREMELCYAAFSTGVTTTAYRRYSATERMLWNLKDLGKWHKPPVPELCDRVIEDLRETFSGSTFEGFDLRIPMQELATHLDKCSAAVVPRKKLVAMLSSIQDRLHPALYHYAKAHEHYNQAWDIRGGGYADTVKEESWDPFYDHIDKAREHAEKAWAAAPAPEIATLLINIARCKAKEPNEWRKWFDEAVALQLDYMPAYHSLLFTIYPRWHGSHRQMLSFGEECLNTRRFDTAVPGFYEVVIRDIIIDSDRSLAVFRKPGVYSNLLDVFNGYLAMRAGNAAEEKQLRTRKVIAAWAAGRYDDAADFLSAVGGDLAQEPLEWYKLSGPRILGEIALFTGPHSNAFAQALAHVEAGRKDEALQSMSALLDQTERESPARFVVEDLAVPLRIEKALEAGKKVSLMPPRNGAGWEQKPNVWSVHEDGSVRCKTGACGADIYTRVSLPRRFEIEGEILLTDQQGSGFFFVGLPTHRGQSRISIKLDRCHQRVSLKKGNASIFDLPCPVRKINVARLKLDGRKLTFVMNDRVLADDIELPAKWFEEQTGNPTIGLLNLSNLDIDGIGFRNLTARKLPDPKTDSQ